MPKKVKYVIEFGEAEGMLIERMAGLFGCDSPALIERLIIEAVKSMAGQNPLYRLDWFSLDPTRQFIWKDYARIYSDFIEALRGDDSYRFDIRQGAGPGAKIKKNQTVLPMELREKMSPKAMMKLEYNVIGIHRT